MLVLMIVHKHREIANDPAELYSLFVTCAFESNKSIPVPTRETRNQTETDSLRDVEKSTTISQRDQNRLERVCCNSGFWCRNDRVRLLRCLYSKSRGRINISDNTKFGFDETSDHSVTSNGQRLTNKQCAHTVRLGRPATPTAPTVPGTSRSGRNCFPPGTANRERFRPF